MPFILLRRRPAAVTPRPAGSVRRRRSLAPPGIAVFLLMTGIAGLMNAQPAQAAAVSITVPTQFRDTSGGVVSAHGGGMLKVGSYYYWFGEARNSNLSFRAVPVYRSTDLRTWEFRGNALTQSSASELNSANIE